MKRLVAGCVLMLLAGVAAAADLVVYCPGAVQGVVKALAADFERDTGQHVKFIFGTAGALAKRVGNGEPGDVAITTVQAQHKLAEAGRVRADSVHEVGRMGVGVAVKAGAPRPDIGTPDAFRAAMLNARSIMYADPAKGGQSGIHVAAVLKRLGIAEAMQPKTQLRPGAPQGLKEVAAGTIDLGLGQISEILAEPGVVLVGPLPPELQNEVAFAGAVMTSATAPADAQRFVRMLVAAPARERFRKAGFRVG